MTPLPDEQPLSRRQLREQQRTTEIPAAVAPPSRRVSTPAVAGGSIPEVNVEPTEPVLSVEEVAALEEAEAQGRPLTRRQARDLDRVRTATFGIIQPESTDASAPDSESADADTSAPQTPDNAPQNPAIKKAAPKSKKAKRAEAANKLPSFVPSSAAADADVVDAEVVDAEIVPDSDDAPASVSAEPHATTSAFGPAATAASENDDVPRLSSSFGQAVMSGHDSTTPAVDQPFDEIIARGLEEAGSGVSTSSIILPSMPNGHPLTGPLSVNGNVVITGSIDLPSGVGSSGVHPDQFDRSDIDAMFDAEDEAHPATGGTPVSASKAVSTHTATRDVITPPTPARSNRLLLILAITAGVLAVAVLAVIIVGIAAGAFQSQ